MIDRPPFKRNQEGLHLYYDVLSSNGYSYYPVEMLGTVALSCPCRAGGFGQQCKHKTTAETAEIAFQEELKKNATSERNTPEARRLAAPFHNAKEFSLLKH